MALYAGLYITIYINKAFHGSTESSRYELTFYIRSIDEYYLRTNEDHPHRLLT